MLEKPTLENAYALIIGISNYKDPNIRKLKYTRADAEGINEILTDPKKVGLNPDKIKILLDENATIFNIKNAFTDWLYKNANKDSYVLIYFAGHGGIEEDKMGTESDNWAKYLLPFDTVKDNLYSSALSNGEFQNLLRSIKSRKLVIFMDSCYSGGVSSGKARDVDVRISDDPYKKLVEGEGRLVIAASQPNQQSFENDGLGHGVFTYHLIEALSGAADYEQNGFVTATELIKYLAENVPKTVKHLEGREQEPLFTGDLKNDFVVAVNNKRICEIDSEKIKTGKIERLWNLYTKKELSYEQYSLACKVVESSYEDLSEGEKNVLKLVNDFLDSKNNNCLRFKKDIDRFIGKETPDGINKYNAGKVTEDKPKKQEEMDSEREKKKQININNEKKYEEIKIEPKNELKLPRGFIAFILLGILVTGYFAFPQSGSVIVNSDPQGASVYFGGNHKGTTPATINDIKSGSYDVRLEKQDYENWSGIVKINPGENASINLSLVQKTGFISVESTPSGARIYLDGVDMGTTPKKNSSIKPGSYNIELKLAGYKDWSGLVQVKVDETAQILQLLSFNMEFVLISKGEFNMGSRSGTYHEIPVHPVTISNAFNIGKYEVTQKQWNDIMGKNPSKENGSNLPVEQVSWNDVRDFINKLNDMEGTNKYRLPTEAEWEYAARAGTSTEFFFGDDETILGNYAWYKANSGSTHEVDQAKQNPWGLYNMHGNVWEWVQDQWHDDYNDAPKYGSSWGSGDYANPVFRGGSWTSDARACRSASRGSSNADHRSPDLGFRLVRDL